MGIHTMSPEHQELAKQYSEALKLLNHQRKELDGGNERIAALEASLTIATRLIKAERAWREHRIQCRDNHISTFGNENHERLWTELQEALKAWEGVQS